MWLGEYDDVYEEENELYYYSELQAPPQTFTEDRPAGKISAPIVSQRKIRDSLLDESYSLEDDDYLDLEDDAVTSTEPGNYWINPVPSPLTSPDESNEVRRRRRSASQPPSLRKTSIRSGAGPKPPPPPLMDFYNRLFWYGLDPSDDVSGEYENEADSEKRTMFGGTKGKFNGLSFLSDAVGVVPPEQQRPYRRGRSSGGRGKEMFDLEEEEIDGRIPNARDSSQRHRVPVTPPYDPPRMPTMDAMEGYKDPSRPQPTQRQDPGDRYRDVYSDDSWDDDGDSFAYPPSSEDKIAVGEGHRRGVRPIASRRNNRPRGDWVTTTVSSWFDDELEEEMDGALSSVVDNRRQASSPQRRHSRRKDLKADELDGSFQYPPVLQTFTGALETFLGIDRELQQRKATEYDLHVGFQSSTRTGRTRTKPPTQSSRQASSGPNKYRPRRTTTGKPAPVSGDPFSVMDAEAIPVGTPTPDESVDSTEVSSKMKPLTWEERALAIDRVPPAGVTAWGPEGAIPNLDARTKALQDAIFDVKMIQNKIKKHEQAISDLKDEMSILKIDIELERHELHNQNLEQGESRERRSRSKNTQRLLEHIRTMELDFENMSRKLRYLQLRKCRAEQESLDLNRRHWALFHCMKQIVANDSLSKQVEDFLYEFNEVEPAAARHYAKIGDRVDATSAPAEVVATEEDVL